jgi:hypothetical protein
MFLSGVLPCLENFAPAACFKHRRKTNVSLNPVMEEVLAFHYKHTVINSWGGTVLKTWLRDFPVTGEWSVDLEFECLSTPSLIFNHTTPPVHESIIPDKDFSTSDDQKSFRKIISPTKTKHRAIQMTHDLPK